MRRARRLRIDIRIGNINYVYFTLRMGTINYIAIRVGTASGQLEGRASQGQEVGEAGGRMRGMACDARAGQRGKLRPLRREPRCLGIPRPGIFRARCGRCHGTLEVGVSWVRRKVWMLRMQPGETLQLGRRQHVF